MSTKLGFDGRLETLSVITAGGLSSILLLILWGSCLLGGTPAPRLPLLMVPAGLLLLAGILGKNKAYRLSANILLGVEWLLMAFAGFHELTRFGTVALPLAYMVLYAGLVWLQWRLKPEETKRYIENSFRDGALKTIGTDIDKIMPPVSRFGGGRAEKKQGVIDRLTKFFEKYFGL